MSQGPTHDYKKLNFNGKCTTTLDFVQVPIVVEVAERGSVLEYSPVVRRHDGGREPEGAATRKEIVRKPQENATHTRHTTATLQSNPFPLVVEPDTRAVCNGFVDGTGGEGEGREVWAGN